jgi:hypothetical protein
MKKIIIQCTAVCITTALMAFSCKKAPPKQCLSYGPAPVSNVQGPSTAAVNQEISLVVAIVYANGCGSFSEFEQQRNGNDFTVSATAKYEGCVCTQALVVTNAFYNFRASQPGVYRFIFTGTGTQVITHTLTVQ